MLEVFEKIAEFLELTGMKNIAKQVRIESKDKTFSDEALFFKKNNALGKLTRYTKKIIEVNEKFNKKLYRRN